MERVGRWHEFESGILVSRFGLIILFHFTFLRNGVHALWVLVIISFLLRHRPMLIRIMVDDNWQALTWRNQQPTSRPGPIHIAHREFLNA